MQRLGRASRGRGALARVSATKRSAAPVSGASFCLAQGVSRGLFLLGYYYRYIDKEGFSGECVRWLALG